MKKITFFSLFLVAICYLSGCADPAVTKTSEEMCVEAQIKVYDQVEKGTKQREYFDTAFKSRDAYIAWAWRECMKK